MEIGNWLGNWKMVDGNWKLVRKLENG